MNCEQMHERLPDYLVDDLDESERTQAHLHLSACPRCRETADRFLEIWRKLEMLSAEEPGVALRARFDAMLEAYTQGLGEARTDALRQRFDRWIGGFWPRRPAYQLGLCSLFLLLGLAIGHIVKSRPSANGELAELRQEVHNMYQLVTLSLLQQQSASERIRGLSWSQRVSQPDPQVLSALLQVLDYDPNANVRLAAVDALQQFSDQSMVRQGLVQALTRQSSPLVQIALIDLLVQIQEKRSVDTFKRMIADENLNDAVKQRAERALKQLS